MTVEKPNVFSFRKINATKFGTKNEISNKIIYDERSKYKFSSHPQTLELTG